jgi:hypothetical protein
MGIIYIDPEEWDITPGRLEPDGYICVECLCDITSTDLGHWTGCSRYVRPALETESNRNKLKESA